ncbi:MAG: hypothetical protein WDN06_20595 [Asticcacaulis sp.]
MTVCGPTARAVQCLVQHHDVAEMHAVETADRGEGARRDFAEHADLAVIVDPQFDHFQVARIAENRPMVTLMVERLELHARNFTPGAWAR